MNFCFRKPIIALAILTIIPHAGAITVYPIATNGNLVEVVGGYATSGTNGLAAILSGTNDCFQLVSTNGTTIGPLTAVGSGASFPLAAFGGGKYLIYWDSNANSGPSVYGQIISPNGTTNGSPFLIPASGNGAPRALASDGTNFLAVYEDKNNGGDTYGYYYGQWITPAGALSGSPFVISGQQQTGNSGAAFFGKTNYLVVWQSNNGSTGNSNQTYGALVTPGGSAGSLFQIGQTASLDQDPLAIGFDGTNYLAVWDQDSQETSSGSPVWNLYARLVSQSGSFPSGEILLNTNQPLFPSLAFDGTNYLLGWSYNLDTTNTNVNVFFQFLNRNASPIGPSFAPFQPQGTNIPIFGGVLFNGAQFGVGATLGSLIVASNGEIQGFASAAAYGGFIPSSTALPQFNNLSFSDHQLSLSLTGTPGINYTIQYVTNAAASNWTALTTNSPTNGPFTFIDSNATNTTRFYRAVKQ